MALRPLAVFSWALGACVALVGSWEWISLTGVAALDAMFVAALSYYLLTKVVGPESKTDVPSQTGVKK